MVSEKLKQLILEELEKVNNKVEFINELRSFISEHSPCNIHPVDLVRWVDIDKVQANDYNPNRVAKNEMRLLHTSIKEDGYTQPIVTYEDKETGNYIIVDGFHRYFVFKAYEDIRQTTGRYIPITVINKDITDRMASTVRHNRARGKHSITGMSNLVFRLLDEGATDKEIMDKVGLSIDELVRLKHLTGFSKLFENEEYKRAWETKQMIKLRKEWEEKESETQETKTE